MKIDPRAGQPAIASDLVDVTKLITAHYEERPDPEITNQRIAFGAFDLAGEKPITIMTTAPGDGNSIGGIKVAAASGWSAARPSGAEAIYKIYAEGFRGEEHLTKLEAEAQSVANLGFASTTPATMTPQLEETK